MSKKRAQRKAGKLREINAIDVHYAQGHGEGAVSAPHAPLVIAARQMCLFKPRVVRELREEDGYPLGE